MENPRIYVASLSDYNNGRLEGKWFDFDDYSDASELMGAIHDMLAEITKKYNDGEEREEWAVHDYENIPPTLATEYMGEQDFQTTYDIIEASEEYGIPTEVLMERVGDTGSEDYQSLAEGLMFVVDGNDESDIVYEMEEQLGELGFDFWQNHIYIDDVTQRVMYSEDLERYRKDIQYDNPDMDEDEVERLAEQQANDEENRRNDDLIGYLEEMEYTDIPTWVSKDYESAWKNEESYNYDIITYDGKMYVFSINYSQGGNVKYEGGGMINGKYLDSLSERSKNMILQNIANHYGISLSEAEEEVRDKDAEMLYEYIANNPTLRMDVYTAIRNKRYDEGGNVQRLSDEDVARIQQAIEQSRHKGIYEKYQENQISPKEAMEFVKENPEVLKLLVLKKGGKINSENYQMLRGKIKEVEHHAKELKSITNRKKEVPAWVLSKSTRASTDLSDITHYMDSAKFDKGGNISYKEQQINEVSSWDNDEIANYLGISISQVAKDRNRYVREAQSVLMLSSYGNGGKITKESDGTYSHPSGFVIEPYEKGRYILLDPDGMDAVGESMTLKEAKETLLDNVENYEYSKGGYLVEYDRNKKTIIGTKKETDDFVKTLKENGHTNIVVTSKKSFLEKMESDSKKLKDYLQTEYNINPLEYALFKNEKGKWKISPTNLRSWFSKHGSLQDIEKEINSKSKKFDNGGGVGNITEKELLDWAKGIDDENLLSWCGYSNKGDFEDSFDLPYSKKNLVETNFEDLEYVYNNQNEYGIKYNNGGGITDYDWANEFRKGKPNKMVVVYRIDGNLMISEVEVEARNETEAYYNTRKQFEAQNPNAKIEKVYTLGDVEAGKFEEGGGVKSIYVHKYNPNITFEVIELTNKGVKGLQKNPKSLSNKEKKQGIIVSYSDAELKELFEKKYDNGGRVDGLSDLIKG